MTCIAKNSFLWQKLVAVIDLEQSLESVYELLLNGVSILMIRFGLHTKEENSKLLNLANDAIDLHSSQIAPWKSNIGIACELSGTTPRVKFDRLQGPIQIFPKQKIFLTSNEMYEDKKFDVVLFVTGIKDHLMHIRKGNLINIGQIKLKVCKVQARFVECCAQSTQDDSTVLLMYPFDKVDFSPSDCEKRIDGRFSDECCYAIQRNCRFIIIPDLDDSEIFRGVEKIVQNVQKSNEIAINILARFSSEASPIVMQNVMSHLSGILTNEQSIMAICRSKCIPVLYETENTEQLPEPEVTSNVDAIILQPNMIHIFKDKLEEFNRDSISPMSLNNLRATRKNTIFTKCIEYATKTCKANAVILCKMKTVCDAIRLSRRSLPCPVLVPTSNDNEMQHLLLRKYCNPIYVPKGMSSRALIKYATVFGKRFGYLKSGNFTVTGFGENCAPGIQLHYVPNDATLLFE